MKIQNQLKVNKDLEKEMKIQNLPLNRETFKNKENNYIEHLENENKKLKQLLETFQNKYNNENDNMKSNMFDLLLYIISGIFIIFILDSFIKLIKNK